LTFHAKAYLRTEETRNLNIHLVESSPFRAGRMSRDLTWSGDADEDGPSPLF